MPNYLFFFFHPKAEEVSPETINKHGHFHRYHQNFQAEMMWRLLHYWDAEIAWKKHEEW